MARGRGTHSRVDADPDRQWVDSETAARVMGVVGSTIRTWCRSGKVSHWRTRGFGSLRRYQISRAALDELRSRYVEEHASGAHRPEAIAGRPSQ